MTSSGLLFDQCLSELASLTLSQQCVTPLLVKGVSLGILGGSVAVKFPQIYKVVRSGSVVGLAESSLVLELLGALSLCLYSFLSGFPFLAYGETFFIALQCLVLNWLFWFYGGLSESPLMLRVLVFGLLFGVTSTSAVFGLPTELMQILARLPITLNILARLPQIILNFRTKSTGQLALLTFLLSFAGNCARVATTLATFADSATLAAHLTAAVLNGTIVAQILLLARTTAAPASAPAAAPAGRPRKNKLKHKQH